MNLLQLLQRYGLTVTTAESCTGGLVASAIVDYAGISSYFQEGYITYSEKAKETLLEVPKTVIDTYGVVSEETARAMAEGVCHRASADIAIATTGVAGPDGGTQKTPVGTVCFGCCVRGNLYSETKCFDGDRSSVRHLAADYAIDFLCRCIITVMEEQSV